MTIQDLKQRHDTGRVRSGSMKLLLERWNRFLNEADSVPTPKQPELTEDQIKVALVVFGEARNQTIGKSAVYHVIKNRSKSTGNSELQIAEEKNTNGTHQFSVLDKNSYEDLLALSKSNVPDQKAFEEVKKIILNPGKDPTEGSTSYLTVALYNSDKVPFWATFKNPCWVPLKVIGDHIFGVDLSSRYGGSLKCYIHRKSDGTIDYNKGGERFPARDVALAPKKDNGVDPVRD